MMDENTNNNGSSSPHDVEEGRDNHFDDGHGVAGQKVSRKRCVIVAVLLLVVGVILGVVLGVTLSPNNDNNNESSSSSNGSGAGSDGDDTNIHGGVVDFSDKDEEEQQQQVRQI